VYYSHCYENGKFSLLNMTLDEMKERVSNKMIEIKFPKFLVKLFTRIIHRLEKWNKQ
jgi:hypothetical protein